MQVVLNHLTRMSAPRICVAGVEPASGRHVRPVTSKDEPITREMLRAAGGPFGVGALVELGEVSASPNPPETEDHRFATAQARLIRDLSDEEYLDLLECVCDEDVWSAFGADLEEIRPGKLAVHAGCGRRSLAVVRIEDAGLGSEYGKLYLRVGGAKLRVTDSRFYESDHETLRQTAVNDVRGRLARGVPGYAMVGLARAIDDEQGGSVHWLMANGLCLRDRAVGDRP